MNQQILSNSNLHLNPNQYALCRNVNTTSLLLSLTESIRRNINKHANSIMFSLDLTKAFDRINHVKLINKLLNKYGFSIEACKLMYSYLCDRSQFVHS